jgi:uncharacterized membrane protein YhaH (DUF805 family)
MPSLLDHESGNQGGFDMGFSEAINTCFSKYATFDGRAARPEYWYFALFVFIVDLVLQALERTGLGYIAIIANFLFSLAVLLPSIAVGVRRLHDIDRSGWWLLIGLVPIVGVILLLVWACMRGTQGTNRFG